MKTEQVNTVEDDENEDKLAEIFANFYERFVAFLEEDDICEYFRIPAPVLASHALDDMINLSGTMENFKDYFLDAMVDDEEEESEKISEPVTPLMKEIKKHLH